MVADLSVSIEVIILESKYMKYITEMDPDTLDKLMMEYGQDVWNFAYLICKKREMADDITQDVFLQAFRHVTSFRGEATLKTWLLKITRNISYNYRNTAFIRKVLLVGFVERAGAYPSAEEDFLEQESANEVWKSVFDLPAPYREVILLDAKHHLSILEIAHVLGIAEGTVKSRLFRARKKLSAMLTKGEHANETI
ncbi:MAG: polymerase sigma factor [Paenibacillus sp.]|jgi:RNA polymerase sigma-70 factor (ECF subfamily)|nr:polymerase sigma factor [Paenibacillus sp.]